MLNDERITRIEFATDYVNKEAISILTDVSHNSYVIKIGTGIGATTALLNHTYGNYIIIIPNVGAIEGKEGERTKFKSNSQRFIYGTSEDQWTGVEHYLDNTPKDQQNLIINTTPDQILIIWKSNKALYNKLIEIPVFVDEIHAYFEESSLRENMGATLELIYNQWKACFTLSTATPTYGFLDIPKNKGIKYYELARENDNPKQIQYSENLKHLDEFVYDEHNKGNTVAVFSNSLSIHKKFTDLKVINLVGDNLALKLNPFDRSHLDGDINYKDYDLIILSSRYFAGFDLELDLSICIVSQQANEAHKINITNLVQAYGRCRKTVHNALYINAASNYDNNTIQVPRTPMELDRAVEQYDAELKHQQSMVDKVSMYHQLEYRNFITEAMYVNRSLLFSNTRNKINDFHQYNKSKFLETLEGYGFEVTEYESTHLEEKNYKSTKLNQRLLNLLNKEEYEFERDYTKIKYNIKHLKRGTFNCKLAMEYLTAYLIKMSGSTIIMDKLYNISFSVKDFYKSFNLFLRANVNTQYYYEQLTAQESSNAHRIYFDENTTERLSSESQLTNDWQSLYSIYQISNSCFSKEIEHEMTKYIEAYNYELYKKYKDDKDHRFGMVKKAIIKRLEKLSEYLNDDELEWLNDVVKDVYSRLDKDKECYEITNESLKSKMVDYLIFLMTDGQGNHGSKLKKSREYNSMVGLPKTLRKINPLIYLEIDLTSATGQIADGILGSNVGLYVYPNLMSNRNISRDKAKSMYNITVNNHELSAKSAKKLYLDCGYSTSEALKLSKMTAKVPKGSFYELITKKEKVIIENYQRALSIKSHRYHDGIVVSMESIELNHITIPTHMDDYTYHVCLHNDGSVYDGLTTSIPTSSRNTIDNYESLINKIL